MQPINRGQVDISSEKDQSRQGMEEKTERKMYPTGVGSYKFYGLPKIHKKTSYLS